MKRILLCSALAHMTLMAEAETGSPAGGAAPAPTAPEAGSSTRIRPDTGSYQTVKTPGGSSTKICGDEVSLALVGAELEETYGFVSKVVSIPVADLKAKYADKNLGQQRMFLGNLIRGASQSKDEAKKARIGAAFKEHLPAFREKIDTRLAAAAAEAEKAKAAKQKEKDDAKAKREADKKAAADKRAKDAAEKKAADEAKKKADAGAKPAEAKPTAKPAAPAQPK